jgi:hypothetical protein
VTFVVLFILAMVWAVYLISWFRSRTKTRSVNSISSFSRHLSVLERTTPGARSTRGGADFGAARTRAGLGPVAAPMAARPSARVNAKKRRKDILVGLLAATAVTALGALLVGGLLRPLFVVALVLTVGYVTLLAQAQKRVLEQREKVRYLGTAPTGVRATPVAAGWDDQRYDDVYEEPTADGTYVAPGVSAYYADPQPSYARR